MSYSQTPVISSTPTGQVMVEMSPLHPTMLKGDLHDTQKQTRWKTEDEGTLSTSEDFKHSIFQLSTN